MSSSNKSTAAKAIQRKLMEAEVISLAWSNDEFRALLESDPAAALKQAGLEPPEGVKVSVTREEPGVLTLVVPSAPPSSAEAEDDELAAVAGGGILQDGKCGSWEIYQEKKKKGDWVGEGLMSGVMSLGALVGMSWGWG